MNSLQSLLKSKLFVVLSLGAIACLVILLLVFLSSGNTSVGSTGDVHTTPGSTIETGSSATIVSNPGFEDGLTGWVAGHVLRDGVSPNEGYTVDISTTVAHSGRASAYIQPTILDPRKPLKHAGYLSTKITASAFRGKRVRYSAYVRTEGQVSSGLWMQVIGTIDGKPTDPDIPMSWDDMVPSRNITGTTDWHQYDIVLDVPQEADFILLGLEAGFGRVWIDDVKLEIVGSDVPTTDRAPAKQAYNLDFEQGLSPWETNTVNVGQATIDTSTEAAHNGKLGARIRQAGGDPDPNVDDVDALIYPTIYGQYYRDKKLQFSTYINVDKAPRGAEIWLYAYYLDSAGREAAPISATIQLPPSNPALKGWQEAEVAIDVPDSTWGISFGVGLHGDGEVWVDEAKLEVLSPTK